MSPGAAGLARSCQLMSRARALPAWASSGKPVTAKGLPSGGRGGVSVLQKLLDSGKRHAKDRGSVTQAQPALADEPPCG